MKTNHMKSLLKISSLFLFLFFLSACSDDKTSNLADSASSFINSNDQVILFGSMDVMSILNKAEYKSVPKFGSIIESQVKRMQSGLNLEAGFYYAMEGPFEGGNPGTTYMFAEVKDLDSLKSVLMKDGYDFDSKDGIEYFRDGDASVGIKNGLAILLTKSGEYDEVELVKKAFTMTTGEVLSGSAAELLAQKADISINTHLYNQFITANNATADMDEDKKNQLADMMKESFAQANIHFENGQLRVAMDNKLSANLTKRMMLNEDAGAKILSKAGNGEPKMAIATNIDMEKTQAWIEDFVPGGMSAVMENAGPLQMAMMAGGGKLSNLFDGMMSFAMFGDPKAGAMVPDFNIYIGFGPNGKPLADLAVNSGMLSGGTMKSSINEKGFTGYSSEVYAAGSGKKVKVPAGCETFGKEGITGFADLAKVDLAGFELEGPGKLVELVKYMNFHISTKGGEILVKLKNSKDNVLKQSVQHMLKEFEGQIGDLSL